MKVVVLDGYLVNFDRIGWDLGGGFEVHWHDGTPDSEAAARIGDAQAVFTNRVPITAEVFAACPALKFVGTFGTGFNAVDLKAATRAGAVVCNVPAYGAQAVAQHAMALLLNIATMAYAHNDYMKAGKWRLPADPGVVARPTFELCGKTIGLIGCGDIGGQMARLSQAFGMRVLAHTRHDAGTRDGVRFTSLEGLLRESDVISLHCPLNEQSRELIRRDTIANMKDGVVLINTARGAVLNEPDVLEALDQGKIYMLGADVFTQEPPAPDDPLMNHPRVFCTPHVAWGPREARKRVLDICAQNLTAWAQGKPQNVVN